MKYQVHYEGYYIIEAKSLDEAFETNKDDDEVEFEHCENTDVEIFGE